MKKILSLILVSQAAIALENKPYQADLVFPEVPDKIIEAVKKVRKDYQAAILKRPDGNQTLILVSREGNEDWTSLSQTINDVNSTEAQKLIFHEAPAVGYSLLNFIRKGLYDLAGFDIVIRSVFKVHGVKHTDALSSFFCIKVDPDKRSECMQDLRPQLEILSMAVIGHAIYSIAESTLGRHWNDQTWFRVIFPFAWKETRSRGLTIARSIDKAFKEAQSMSELIVVLNSSHFESTKDGLIQKLGYKEVEIPVF